MTLRGQPKQGGGMFCLVVFLGRAGRVRRTGCFDSCFALTKVFQNIPEILAALPSRRFLDPERNAGGGVRQGGSH